MVIETTLLRDTALLATSWQPLRSLPKVIRRLISVESVRERWSADTLEILCRARVVDGVSLPFGPLELVVGSGASRAGGSTALVEVRITLSAPAALEAIGTVLTDTGVADVDALLVLSRELGVQPAGTATGTSPIDSMGRIGVVIEGVPLGLLLPESVVVPGRHLRDAAGVIVGVGPDPDAHPVALPLGRARLTASTDGDLSIEFSRSDEIVLPPLFFPATGLAVEAESITLFAAADPKPASIIEREGFGEHWAGIELVRASLWGTDTLVPFLAEGTAIVSNWLLDGRGLSGTLSLSSVPTRTDLIDVSAIDVSFERSWWPSGFGGRGTLDVGTLLGGDRRDLPATFDLHVDPFAPRPEDRASVTVTLGGGSGDEALVTLDGSLERVGLFAGVVAAALGHTDAGLLLGAAAALEAGGFLDWHSLSLQEATLAITREPDPDAPGELRRCLQGVLRGTARADLELLGERVPLVVDTGEIALRLPLGETGPELSAAGASIGWAFTESLSLSLPAAVDIGGMLLIDRVSASIESASLLVELGTAPSGSDDVATHGLPNVIGFRYTPPSTITPFVRRGNEPVSILVPGVIYASGTLERGGAGVLPGGAAEGWGQPLRGRLRAFLIGNGTASTPAHHLEKEHYLLDLDIGLLAATRADGLQAIVLTLDAGFRPGIVLGTSGASLYGLGLTYAQNARPGVENRDYARWFLDTPEKYSTNALKWVVDPGQRGFGAAVTIGSAGDNGRAFNVAAGLFLLTPGPAIVMTGRGNVFESLPTLPAEGGDPENVAAAFAATVVLDLLRKRFEVDVRASLEKQAGPVTLLKVEMPAEVMVDLVDPTNFHLYIGRRTPPEHRVSATGLGFPDISTYLMLEGGELPGILPSVLLPGIALAMGAAGGIDRRFRAGPVSIGLSASIGYDVGLSLDRPPLLQGRIYAEGSLHAKAFGIGIELDVGLSLSAIAPKPFLIEGAVRVRIGMPWFLPDINVQAQLRIGDDSAQWPDDYPWPEVLDPVEAISWVRPEGHGHAVLGSETHDVPIDAAFLIAFAVPVGNESADLGSFQVNGEDTHSPVWAVATSAEEDGHATRYGHRFIVDKVSLVVTNTLPPLDGLLGMWSRNTQAGNLAARGQPLTRGGVVARTALQLCDVEREHVVRPSGSARVQLQEHLDAFDPCSRERDPKSLVHLYTMAPLHPARVRPGIRPGSGLALPNIDIDRVELVGSTPIVRPETPTANLVIDSLERPIDAIGGAIRPSTPILFLAARVLEAGEQRTLLPTGSSAEKRPLLRLDVMMPSASTDARFRALNVRRTPAALHFVTLRLRSPMPAGVEDAPVLGLPVLERRLESHPSILSPPRPPTEVIDALLDRVRALGAKTLGAVRLRLPAHVNTRVFLAVHDNVRVLATGRDPDGGEHVLTTSRFPTRSEPIIPLLLVPQEKLLQDWKVHVLTVPAEIRRLEFGGVGVFGRAGALALDDVPFPALALLAVELIAPMPGRNRSIAAARRDYRALLERAEADRDDWAAGGTGSLLRPDTSYRLSVAGRVVRARERGGGALELETGGKPFRHEVTFVTASRASSPLRAFGGTTAPVGPLAVSGSLEDGWEVATVPIDGCHSHYRDEPLVIRFRDARTIAAWCRYGVNPRLTLSGTDGHRIDLSPSARFRSASDLTEDEALLRTHRLGAKCLDIDLRREAFWEEHPALHPGVRYAARIEDRRDGTTFHEWRFRASRYRSLLEHLSVHRVVDELVVDDDRTLAASLAAQANALPLGIVRDEFLLEHLLYELIGAAVREPPRQAELVQLWSWRAEPEESAFVALLLDGPEPLLRSGSAFEVHRAGAPLPVRMIVGQSGARALVIFPGSAPTASERLSLRIAVGGSSNGTAPTAEHAIVLPPTPAPLVEDAS